MHDSTGSGRGRRVDGIGEEEVVKGYFEPPENGDVVVGLQKDCGGRIENIFFLGFAGEELYVIY